MDIRPEGVSQRLDALLLDRLPRGLGLLAGLKVAGSRHNPLRHFPGRSLKIATTVTFLLLHCFYTTSQGPTPYPR
jgi:hypothetical protein